MQVPCVGNWPTILPCGQPQHCAVPTNTTGVAAGCGGVGVRPVVEAYVRSAFVPPAVPLAGSVSPPLHW